jgi:hypothetical protein
MKTFRDFLEAEMASTLPFTGEPASEIDPHSAEWWRRKQIGPRTTPAERYGPEGVMGTDVEDLDQANQIISQLSQQVSKLQAEISRLKAGRPT